MFTTFVNLLTLVVSAPLNYVSQVRQASQKPSHTWIIFCQWYFPRLSVKDHFALVHLSVRYVLPQLLKQLLLYGPAYRIVLPNNIIDNLKDASHFGVSITEFVEMIELLVMYESEIGENVFESGVCPVQTFKDFVSLSVRKSKNIIKDIDLDFHDHDYVERDYSYLASTKELHVKKVDFWVGVLNLVREKKILTLKEKKMQTILSLLINEKGREFGDCFHAFILPKIKESFPSLHFNNFL